MSKRKIESNIWKYYLWRFFCGISLTIPIFVLFLKENGLNITQIMILQSVYTTCIIVFSILAGALADKYGRKKILIISSIALTLGYFAYGTGMDFWHFFFAEIIYAIGAATFLGIGEAFVYDSLKNIKKENSYKKVQGIAYGISEVMMGLTGILGAAVAAAISLRSTYFISMIPASITIFIALSFKEPKHQKNLFGDNYFKHIFSTAKFILSKSELKFIIIFFGIMATVRFMSFFIFPLYFENIGIPLKYFGIAFAALFISSAIGNKICHNVEKFFSNKTLIKLIVIGTILTLVFVGIFKNIYGVIFGSIMWFIGGLRMAIIPDIINKHASGYHRATVLSIGAAFSNLVSAISSPIIGWTIDKTSASKTFIVLALVLIIYLIYVLIFLRNKNI